MVITGTNKYFTSLLIFFLTFGIGKKNYVLSRPDHRNSFGIYMQQKINQFIISIEVSKRL